MAMSAAASGFDPPRTPSSPVGGESDERRLPVEVLALLFADGLAVRRLLPAVGVRGGCLGVLPDRHRRHEGRSNGGASPQHPVMRHRRTLGRAAGTQEPDSLGDAEPAQCEHDHGPVVGDGTAAGDLRRETGPGP